MAILIDKSKISKDFLTPLLQNIIQLFCLYVSKPIEVLIELISLLLNIIDNMILLGVVVLIRHWILIPHFMI